MTESVSVTDTRSNILFVGLSATGKTTYLALLYRAIVAEKAGTLRLGDYEDDREYVNEIAEALASCTVADRTVGDQQGKLALSLTTGDKNVYLTVPDTSGESWEHTLSDRGWTKEVDGRVADAVGFILFVHSGHIDTQPTIAEMHAGMAALVGDDGNASFADLSHTAGTQRMGGAGEDVGRTRATQVSIVDLLQLLSSRHSLPIRVSLIVSAWDLVPEGETPEGWVSENLPLVQQFIETNTGWLELKTWGVSAQGGDFAIPERRQQLLPQDAVDRSLTRASDGQDCAIEDPVAWVLGLH
jgi:hypothetical protein